MSTHLLSAQRPTAVAPLARIREQRALRTLVAGATVTGILSVTIASIAMMTVGLGA